MNRTIPALALLIAIATPAFADDYGTPGTPPAQPSATAPNSGGSTNSGTANSNTGNNNAGASAYGSTSTAAGSSTSSNGYYLNGQFYAAGTGPMANGTLNGAVQANTASYVTPVPGTAYPSYSTGYSTGYVAPGYAPAYTGYGYSGYGYSGYGYGSSYSSGSAASSYDRAPHGTYDSGYVAYPTSYTTYPSYSYGNGGYGYDRCCCGGLFGRGGFLGLGW